VTLCNCVVVDDKDRDGGDGGDGGNVISPNVHSKFVMSLDSVGFIWREFEDGKTVWLSFVAFLFAISDDDFNSQLFEVCCE
jgi:hypothetical protein